MKFQKPKGTKDLIKDIYKWHFVENEIFEVMNNYNFKEIRTPTFESTDLFKRGVGSETDIVGKEMYTFEDKGKKSLTLRPEGTASIVRAYIENGLFLEVLSKFYYIANMFRYENPQEGRFREHTQFGGEIIGSLSIYSDVEVILIAKEVYNRCGIDNFKIYINSIGQSHERNNYISKLLEHLKKYERNFSEDNKRRLKENPLRLLDIKENLEFLLDAPNILDSLSIQSRNRLDSVINELEKLNIKCEINEKLVRGLDYYNDTIFEFISEDLGAQNALGGGGRYDGLIEQLGGKSSPSVGFGSGIERIISVAEKNNFNFGKKAGIDIYAISQLENYSSYLYQTVSVIRHKRFSAEFDLANRSFNKQMKIANKLNSNFVIILRNDYVLHNNPVLVIKDMNYHFEFDLKMPNHFEACAIKVIKFITLWRYLIVCIKTINDINEIKSEMNKEKSKFLVYPSNSISHSELVEVFSRIEEVIEETYSQLKSNNQNAHKKS